MNFASLKKSNPGIDFSQITKVLDALNAMIENFPRLIPEIKIISKHVNNILQFLDCFEVRPPILVEMETDFILLGSHIYLAGVIQKIINKPNRRAISPRGKIWKNLKAIFPRFLGFDLDVYGGGTTYLYQKANPFLIKFRKHVSGEINTNSSVSSNQDILIAMKVFEPLLNSFVKWEMEKYRLDEYFRIWIMEKDLMFYCEFDWRSWDEAYDPSR